MRTILAALFVLTNAAAAPSAQFAMVNGVRLHYLDWGGTGAPVLFLTCLGCPADDFNPLALPLTSNHRVLGLTRRGQGLSEKPESGYDTATLTADIKAFVDLMKLDRVILIGYSLAGNEETEFARRYPERVAKLVYLDAAYDLHKNAELGKKANLDLPPLPGADKPTLELIARSEEYIPDYTTITAPALGFFVTYETPPQSKAWDERTRAKLLQWWIDYGEAYRRNQIKQFRKQMRNGKVIELFNTTHGSFVYDAAPQKILIREIVKFLDS